ncbi:MAG: hypothetical protein COU33_04110 [Candidatus Magasanikbacteria bacterium CG10_big_fil_rev_8_21_14_0_10_43_6]|uniref:Uncharacterized protein n=1 Tax=Candidatus Magasanikbacteria bacterium CG10_big_fil_rev_8_21_14_0_10_43_6 TaxID=1974650 RepID=A0A2M6W0G2_9BACT|nr:MAG: hypothetical protein COU33_04110 [Candidatus Magasanikbacteria bacterium CG10_big_fil_rev_8_21_14_0_10_43_6]
MKTITVQGMHCGACEKLIRMELDDAGLESFVDSVEIESGEKKGIFCLKEGISEEQVEKIKQIINGMEGYSTE